MSAHIPYPNYRVPEGWQDGERFSSKTIWTLGIITAGIGIASALLTASGSPFWGITLAVVFGLLALLNTALGLYVTHRRVPQLVNAITLTRAKWQPADDWVLFFHERPIRTWSRGWLTFSGLGTGALLWWSMPRVLDGPGGLWWLILFVPLLITCIVLLACGLAFVWLDGKNSSFGRIPTGVSLGAHGMTYYQGTPEEWLPWESITSIEALPLERIRIHRYGLADPLEFGIGFFDQESAVIYNVLQFYWLHPKLQPELSTSFGQARVEAWLASVAPRGTTRVTAPSASSAGSAQASEQALHAPLKPVKSYESLARHTVRKPARF